MNIPEAMTCKTAEEAADNLAALESTLADAQRALTKLEAERESVLVFGDDKKINQSDQEIAAAQKQIERLTAAKKHLESRLVELEATEDKSRATTTIKAAEKAQRRGMEIYREFSEQAKRIASLVEELRQIHDEINAAREIAADAGVACALQLPHFALSEPDQDFPAEYEPGPTYDKPIYEFRGGVGVVVGYEQVQGQRLKKEREFKRGRKAADLTAAKIQLPDPMDQNKVIIKTKAWAA